MAFNETIFLSFIIFRGDSDRINHFFYQLLGMYPVFIPDRNTHATNQYITGNHRSDTRFDVGCDPANSTFLNRSINGGFIPGHGIPYNLVITAGMFCVYRWDVRRRYSHRTGKFHKNNTERPPHR
jgi:hypothetical protein